MLILFTNLDSLILIYSRQKCCIGSAHAIIKGIYIQRASAFYLQIAMLYTCLLGFSAIRYFRIANTH